jgi:DNA invertase Pin-like site-specific DNA recombinase
LGYARFSSDEQKGGNSIERQTQNIKGYCQRNGLTLSEILIDDGYSASTGQHLKRGKHGKFLKRIAEYRGYAFVIEELDRLSRLGISATDDLMMEPILAAGLTIHVTQESRVIESRDDLMTVIYNAVKNYGAKEYTDKLKERVSRSWGKKKVDAADGTILTPQLPSWLDLVDGQIVESTRFDVVQGEKQSKVVKLPADTVRRVFRAGQPGLRIQENPSNPEW